MLLSCVVLIIAAISLLLVYQTSSKLTKLVFGYSQEAPYAFINDQTQLDGVFVTAAELISDSLQISSRQWLLIEFYELLGSLQSERINVIAAGLTITPERAQKVCFAEPLLQAPSAMLTLAEPLSEQPGQAKLAVLANSVEHLNWQQTSEGLLLVASVREGAMALLEGRASHFALTKPAVLAIMRDFPERFRLDDPQGLLAITHFSAFAFDERNQQLLYRWNQLQRELQQQADFVDLVHHYGFTLPTLGPSIARGCYAR